MNPLDALIRTSPVQGAQGQRRSGDPLAQPTTSTDFAAELDALLNPPASEPQEPAPTRVHFSKHAAARLSSRGIELSDQDIERISGAIDQLEAKGAKESLVLLGDTALIVGVPKRTVITAMSRDEAIGNLFTGIDSAVMAA